MTLDRMRFLQIFRNITESTDEALFDAITNILGYLGP